MVYKETNLNNYIKVKLTDEGIDIIKTRYGSDFPIKIDNEGYTAFQMWDFARLFGNYMNMFSKMICETNVMIQVKEIEK